MLLYKHLTKFIRTVQPWTRQQYVDNIPNPSKRKSYQDCLDRLEQGGKIYSRVTPHNKIEKFKATKGNTFRYKAPRLIQARDQTFNIECGRYIKPLEQLLKLSSPNFAKGNYDEIGRRVEKLARKYKYYTEADHKTFDAHVTPEQLKLTHKFYLRCFKNDKTLESLLKKKIKNRIKTRDGTTWTVHGTRMSGDVDTSLGNSLINYAIIKQVLQNLRIDGDAIVNGDDSIIFTNEPIDTSLARMMFALYNQETEIGESQTNIHRVEFCRTRLVYPATGKPTMMMDPDRLNDVFGMTHKNIRLKDYDDYLINVKLANATINRNTPLGYYWNTGERPKSNKHLDFDLLRVLEREKFNQCSTTEITVSMFLAYPNLSESLKTTQKLVKMHKPRIKSTSWMIDHDNQTLQMIPD